MRNTMMSRLGKWLGWLMLLGVLAALGTAPVRADTDPAAAAAAAAAPTDAMGRILNAGVIRIGVVAMTPWAMQDSGGEWTGLNVDIGRKLAADLGVRVQFVRTSWDSAADDAADGHLDVAVGMWPGPRRALVVNFSDAYAETVVQLVAKRAKVAGLARASDFDKPEVRLGMRSGGMAESVVRQKLERATLVPFVNDEALLQALLNGGITALVSRSPTPMFIALADAKDFVMPLSEPLSRRGETFAIARGDADFLSYLNTWIRFHEDTGWLPERRAYWLHSLAWQGKK